MNVSIGGIAFLEENPTNPSRFFDIGGRSLALSISSKPNKRGTTPCPGRTGAPRSSLEQGPRLVDLTDRSCLVAKYLRMAVRRLVDTAALLAGKWNDFLSCDSDWIRLSRRNWRIQDMTRTPAKNQYQLFTFSGRPTAVLWCLMNVEVECGFPYSARDRNDKR
jgi:hypothetical protein